jgi:YgiT-type zinc finger domain-containing protein
MTTCHICHTELEERRVTRVQQYQGHWYIIENLPALVCPQCGETYYTPESHDRVIDLITGNSQPVRIESVVVLDATPTI